jgi:PAS domain S-box-containing protein
MLGRRNRVPGLGQSGVEPFMERSGRAIIEPDALRGVLSGNADGAFIRLLLEHAPAAIAVLDRDLRYVAASRRWYEDYELPDENIIGRRHYDVFPDVPERWREDHRRCLAGEALRNEADEFVRADGRSVWIRWELLPLRVEDGVVGLMMLTEVITRRVEAEAAKVAGEEELISIERIAHVGRWDWDLATGLVRCSAEMCRLIGIGPGTRTLPIGDLLALVHPEDRAMVAGRVGQVQHGDSPRPELEMRVVRPDGITVWIQMMIRATRDAVGRPVVVYGVIHDVSDVRQTQRELAFRDRAIETAASPIAIANLDGKYVYANSAFRELLGVEADADVIGKGPVDFLVDPGQLDGTLDLIRRERVWRGEARFRRRDGLERDVSVYGKVIDEDGQPYRIVISYSDVTERNQALRELSHRESELRQAQELARLGRWRFDLATRTYHIPPETRLVLGLGEEFASYDRTQARSWIHPEDLTALEQATAQVLRGRAETAEAQYRYIGQPRGTVHVRVLMGPDRDAAGHIVGMSGLIQDVTSFRELEEAHRETERAMSALMRNLSGMVYRCDNDQRWTMRFVSDASKRVLGYDPWELIDNRVTSYGDVTDPRDRQRVWDTIQEAVNDRRPFQLSYRVITKDGDLRWVLEQGSAIRDAQDEVVALEGYIADITAEQRAVERLQESEARNRAIMESASVAIFTADERGVVESFNPEAERLFGHVAGEVIGRHLSMLLPEAAGEGWAPVGAEASLGAPRELTGRRRGGEEFPLDLAVSEMRQGERRVLIGSVRDLTERKKAEARFAQAQKMETVGQLVGGVAHDFNNLLMAMQLNLELAGMIAADRPEAAECIGVALKAVDRGAELTKRLLAFSRQQPLEPKVIDANGLVRDMMRLMHRLLQEDIEVRTALRPETWPVEVDPAQLETALVNLVVNARDAMPAGGKLTIETANVTLDPAYAERHDDLASGPYVQIAVSDTGTGMPPDVLERAFDPFFTTKEVGKGSGLGLSMVYGFVKQSGGHVALYSEPGQGTTVKLYFPRAAAARPEQARVRGEAQVRPGDESVLLVEDDADVRQTVERLLRSLGYAVVSAADGPEALALIDAGLRPDLLLADVVLPKGMSGRDVSEAVSGRVPTCRTLFMSGYTEDAVMHHGRLDEGVVLLSKPFPRELLASKVRELLDR